MDNNDTDMTEFHWFMDILQTIDAGLVVLDRQYNIKLWNGFMENHSGIRPDQAKGENLFTLFPEIDSDWFKKKAESVFLLNTRAFTISEQRPFLFKFKNNYPIT
ncbi:MAG: PAS domain S-box-containing protein, partial [Bermanella sp.]